MHNTREKLIELVNNVLRCLPWGEISSHTAEDVADCLIANGVTLDNQVSKWISVKDRLPDLELVEVKTDDNDLFPCLAVRKHPRAKNGKYTAKVWYDGYGFIDGISNDVTDEVTHWMPLPQPPKGE